MDKCAVLLRAGRVLLLCVVTFVLTACALMAAPPPVAARITAAYALAAQAGMQPLRTATPLPLQGFSHITRQGADLHVYIEGDGRAWLSAHMPSPNPTPVNPVALQLAVKDAADNVVYLARPGQYLADDELDQIEQRYWLGARFAAPVIDSYVLAIRGLAQASNASAVHLVGFSGGAAVAALVAAKLQADVSPLTEQPMALTLRTLGGNLDIVAWTHMRRLTPLSASLNPADFAAVLQGVPQLHLVGRLDRQVPPAVLASFLARFSSQACVRVIEVDNAHAGPWQAAWQAVAAVPPVCLPPAAVP